MSGLPRREHRLRVHIATLGDAAAGRIALGDEDGTLLLAVVLHIAQMDAAVAQFAVVQVRLLGTFARQLRDARHRLALVFALGYFVEHHLCHIGMDVQIVVYVLLDEVAHVFVDAFATRAHRERAQLDFGLTLEHRFLHVDGDSRHDTVSDIYIVEVLARIFLDGFGDVFLESTLVRTTLCGVLAVDKRWYSSPYWLVWVKAISISSPLMWMMG